jgi:hypothetical protein
MQNVPLRWTKQQVAHRFFDLPSPMQVPADGRSNEVVHAVARARLFSQLGADRTGMGWRTSFVARKSITYLQWYFVVPSSYRLPGLGYLANLARTVQVWAEERPLLQESQ